MDKSLEDKAIEIKGRSYVQVKDRITYFNDTYANGSIETVLISSPDALTVVIKAIVTPDVAKPELRFTGHSQARIGDGMVNKTSALENAETSAVGRALGMMGIGVIESIASADEMNKASYGQNWDEVDGDIRTQEVDNSYDNELQKGTPSQECPTCHGSMSLAKGGKPRWICNNKNCKNDKGFQTTTWITEQQ